MTASGKVKPLTLHWRYELRRELTEAGAEFLENQLEMTFPWLFRPEEWIVGFRRLPGPDDEISHIRATRLVGGPGLVFEAVTSRADYDPALLGRFEKLVRAALNELDRADPSQDSLTGILNRNGFRTQIERSVVSADLSDDQRLWIYLIDLDGFKAINDHGGHEAGDQVLKAAARRIASVLPREVAFGRMGGDEFAAAWIADETQGETLLETIRGAFGSPLDVSGVPVLITASVGAASGDGLKSNVDEILVQADEAMYRAKVAKKTGVHAYSS
jgi:diguanylate cyclase (GGDEF)-like protein